MNYANTTTYKTTITRANVSNTGALTREIVGLWASTAAINSITFMYATFSVGTIITIYGIKAA